MDHSKVQMTGLFKIHNIYPFSDSIDHMKYCIVVRPKISETYHLVTSSKIQRDAWLFRLKQSCKGDGSNKLLIGDLNKPLPENPRTVYSLTVRIAEARRLQTSPKDSMHSELYCDVVVDNEIRGLTGSIKKSSSVFWKEEFQFSDISKVNYGVTINMYTKGNKNDRETMFGIVFLPVSLIDASNTIQEEWYEIRKENRHKAFASLTSLGSSNGFCGQIRVGVLLEKYKVYSLDIYQPLMDVLTEFRHDMVYDMARKSSDVQVLARNLLRIYEGMSMTLAWMKSLIDYEVSGLNTVLDNYMRMNGKEFLEESLQHTIQNICKLGLHIEVEPSRLTNSTLDSTMANSSELFSYVRFIWEDIQKAKTKCPMYEIRLSMCCF
ncbi:uncharacterized protein B0P05DRAFT_581162 [Gilbertella persicaria]|uniref:uncharacterized protein n=1 Tax=Gilbertella persicaria TaxID=101096 RepID=UPI00221EFAA7|nr:uncharacterized protein B0P05DRAFT_581162 [Gilbertella persicaria]KAI8062811.1 hypothetical protein B0P05DRAFT_581162 [Gilbertella persicaria]